MYLLPVLLLLSIVGLQAKPQEAVSRYGDIKYNGDFKSFDYVNPNAPQGGTLNLGVLGTFDSTNPFITKGTPPVGLSLFTETVVFESLMKRSADEPFSLYGLIAESCEIAPDNSYIIFNINPQARWADGQPITVKDIQFSYETLRTKGRPNLKLFYGRVKKVEILNQRSIKFYLSPDDQSNYDAELPYLMALMSIIPQHIYAGRDFEKVSMEKVVGSGPYQIASLKPGHMISYHKRPDYWGAHLAINQGINNFDHINVIYYREPNVALMAFAAGNYDVKVEQNPTAWFRNYDFNAVKTGQIIKKTIFHQQPVGMHGYCFNQRRELFKNRDVRHALALIFPFESINKNLFFDSYVRNKSYCDNTDLASSGLPTDSEKMLLENFKDELPSELMTTVFDPTDGLDQKGRINKARQLLSAAGWVVKQGQLTHIQSNTLFKFEILLFNKDEEKIALAYGRELKKLGIKLTIRTLDTAQFESRRLKLEFDCISQTWGGSYSPGNEQKFYWNSAFADIEGSRNYAGIKRKVVDSLCNKLNEAKDRTALKNVAHALDRVLLWDYMVVPLYYNPKKFIAYWRKLDHPTFNQKGTVLFQTWWDASKRTN